jgi:hypothetical protein
MALCGESTGVLRITAALVDTNSTQPSLLPAMQAEARAARNVELLLLKIAKADEIATAIEAAKASHATALNVLHYGALNFLSGNDHS